MGHIDIFIMEKAALELIRESNMLFAVQKQTEQLLDEGRNAYLAGQMKSRKSQPQSYDSILAVKRLQESIAVMEKEVEPLRSAAESLHRCMLLYRHAQNLVIDTIHGECPVVPRTEFGKSRFESLHFFEKLIPVSVCKPEEKENSGIKDNCVSSLNQADLNRIL